MGKIDENYFKTSDKDYTRIDEIIDDGEKILWRGKPKKSAYVLNAFLKMLPIAIIWLAFDGAFIGLLLTQIGWDMIPAPMKIFIFVFFAFHLVPVWIWIANVVTANRQHKNLEYAFTNRRIIVRSGIIGIDFKNVFYTDVEAVNLKVGIVDKMLKVGDIYISSKAGATVLFDIDNPYFITGRLQKIVSDIKTDTLFPNNLRPDENDGYKTDYKG